MVFSDLFDNSIQDRQIGLVVKERHWGIVQYGMVDEAQNHASDERKR